MNTIEEILERADPANSIVTVYAHVVGVEQRDNAVVLQLRDGSNPGTLCAHIGRSYSDYEFAQTLSLGRAIEVRGVMTEATVPLHQYSVQISRVLPCLGEQVVTAPRYKSLPCSGEQVIPAQRCTEQNWRYRKTT